LLELKRIDNKLSLITEQGNLYVDFLDNALYNRISKLKVANELIARACGLHKRSRPIILDATAGLGNDAYILANFGAKLILIEENPFIFKLLEDGIWRLQASSLPCKNNFLKIYNKSAQEIIPQICNNMQPDIIYLDPMFEKIKKNTASKKEMQILQNLIATQNTDNLLELALTYAAKVVVKRARKGGFLANKKPNHQIIGSANRFDVYLRSYHA